MRMRTPNRILSLADSLIQSLGKHTGATSMGVYVILKAAPGGVL